MTFSNWIAQTNTIIRRLGCPVVIAPKSEASGTLWRSFHTPHWSPERMAAAFVDWANEPKTEDGHAIRQVIRDVSSNPDRAEHVIQQVARGELVKKEQQ